MNISSSFKYTPVATKEDLPSDLKGACKALEQQFLNMVMESMRKAAMPGPQKGSDAFSKDVAMSMFQDVITKKVTEGDGVGIWKMIYDQLKPADTAKAEKPVAEKGVKGIVRPIGHIIG